jgi:carbon starvation protein
LGGINSLWPLFGIANQMLAAIALCLATTLILKMQLRDPDTIPRPDPAGPALGVQAHRPAGYARKPWLALVAFVPMIWLVSVTFTAGVQKIWHDDPRIGFLAQARVLEAKQPALKAALDAARAAGEARGIEQAENALHANHTLHFNNVLDAFVAGVFLTLVSFVLLLSVREWILLLARRKLAQLHETKPVWLPDYAVVEGRPFRLFHLIPLSVALARELSGEAQVERNLEATRLSGCANLHGAQVQPPSETGALSREAAYLQMTEKRFRGVNRCC